MPDINPSLPEVGQPDATEEPKIVTALQTLIAAVNDLDGANITDLSIALADLAANSVNSSKIVDGSVTGTDVASDTLDRLKINDGLVVYDAYGSNTDIRLKTFDATVSTGGSGGWVDIVVPFGFTVASTPSLVLLQPAPQSDVSALLAYNPTSWTTSQVAVSINTQLVQNVRWRGLILY